MNVPNKLIKENMQNYFGYKIKMTKLQKTLLILGAIPVEPRRKET